MERLNGQRGIVLIALLKDNSKHAQGSHKQEKAAGQAKGSKTDLG